MHIQSLNNGILSGSQKYNLLKNNIQNIPFYGLSNKAGKELSHDLVELTRKIDYKSKNKIIEVNLNFPQRFKWDNEINAFFAGLKNSEGNPRFKYADDLSNVIAAYKQYPESTKKLLAMEFNGKFRFDAEDIEELTLLHSEGYENKIKKYGQVCNIYKGHQVPIYSGLDIRKFIEIGNKGYSKEVDELISITDKQGNHIFVNNDFMSDLIQVQNEGYGKEIKILANILDDENCYRFNDKDISYLVKLLRAGYSDDIYSLAEMKDNKGRFCFDGKDISDIIKINKSLKGAK